MIDDPFSLLSLGIWLMAAGMYPLGFMFGVCSACCDEECDDCACYFNEYKDYQCRPITCFPNVSQTISIDAATLNNAEANIDGNFWDIGNSSVSITGDSDGEPVTITNIAYQYVMTENGGQPKCSGTECQHFIQFFAYPDDTSSVTRFASPVMLLFTSAECAPLNLNKNFDNIEWTLEFGNEDSIWDNMKAYLETLTPNVLLSYDACECCSKCTHAYNFTQQGGGCPFTVTRLQYDVEDYGSAEILNPITGDVVSDCLSAGALNLTEEQVQAISAELTSVCIRPIEITSIPQTSECDCPLCCNDVIFRARFIPEGGGDSFLYDSNPLFCFDRCDETESTENVSGWGISDAPDNALSELILAWLNSLTFSATVTVDPCDCGACCDDGCEDNVAEGGCDNWAGVGTDCGCPDSSNPCEE